MGRGWGIIGSGKIAASFAAAIVAEGDRVVAVASSSQERADRFAAAHRIPGAYQGRDALLADADVEVVYVATTNERHHLDALAAIAAGRPVVVEKPLAVTPALAREVVAAARAAGVFITEAMWMRVQPGFLELQRRLARGDVGTPLTVQADFGIVGDPDPTRRLFSAELGGGALLDVGIYPATLAVAVLGPATSVRATGVLAATGVDAQAVVAMTHGGSAVSAWTCSLVAETGIEATVGGDEALLRIASPFHHPPQLELRVRERLVETVPLPGHELGLQHEVHEVQHCLDAGVLESDRIPLEASLEILDLLAEVRAQLPDGTPPPPS
ncbi:MAG: Gfo/Idh/MocA family protein [Nitriliruptoraceae bacterium]